MTLIETERPGIEPATRVGAPAVVAPPVARGGGVDGVRAPAPTPEPATAGPRVAPPPMATVTAPAPPGPAPSPPVTFQRVVLVGVDDPFLAQQLAAGEAPVGGPTTRSKLSITIASVVVLLCFVAGLAWLRFDDLSAMPAAGGPVPEVAITPSAGALADGGAVEVAVGAGGAVERVDVFVDGDWTGVDTTAPFAPEWEHRSPGVHEVKAKVTTADGAVRYSDPVEVTIEA